MSDDKAIGVLDRVLSYVDSPFKLIAIIVMAVVAFVGYLFWQNQAFLISAYQEQKRMPSIHEERVDDAASVLFKHTEAKFVAVFKVNPILGTRVLHRLYTKDGRTKEMEGLDVGLFTSNHANNNDVVLRVVNVLTIDRAQGFRIMSAVGTVIRFRRDGSTAATTLDLADDYSVQTRTIRLTAGGQTSIN